ncbi:hypothetical protein EDB19DRAFT_317154 [Suillus lakei]|nr:hypothetical protein EDB19DRAFT_317154 [Suillus lakei]
MVLKDGHIAEQSSHRSMGRPDQCIRRTQSHNAPIIDIPESETRSTAVDSPQVILASLPPKPDARIRTPNVLNDSIHVQLAFYPSIQPYLCMSKGNAVGSTHIGSEELGKGECACQVFGCGRSGVWFWYEHARASSLSWDQYWWWIRLRYRKGGSYSSLLVRTIDTLFTMLRIQKM